MGAKDLYHDIVKRGLEEKGWTITADPFTFNFGEVNFQIDLSAECISPLKKISKK